MDFGTLQVLVTTLLLAPAMIALIVFAFRWSGDESDTECRGALRSYEPDWWSEEETT